MLQALAVVCRAAVQADASLMARHRKLHVSGALWRAAHWHGGLRLVCARCRRLRLASPLKAARIGARGGGRARNETGRAGVTRALERRRLTGDSESMA